MSHRDRPRDARVGRQVAETLAPGAGGQHRDETDQIKRRQPVHDPKHRACRNPPDIRPPTASADHPQAEQQLAHGLPDGCLEHEVVEGGQGDVQREPGPVETERECVRTPPTMASPTTTARTTNNTSSSARSIREAPMRRPSRSSPPTDASGTDSLTSD